MAASEDGSQRNAAATETADDTSSVGPSVSYDVSLKYSFNQRSAVWQHVAQSAAVLRRVKWGHNLGLVVKEAKQGTPEDFDPAATLGVDRTKLERRKQQFAAKKRAKVAAEEAEKEARRMSMLKELQLAQQRSGEAPRSSNSNNKRMLVDGGPHGVCTNCDGCVLCRGQRTMPKRLLRTARAAAKDDSTMYKASGFVQSTVTRRLGEQARDRAATAAPQSRSRVAGVGFSRLPDRRSSLQAPPCDRRSVFRAQQLLRQRGMLRHSVDNQVAKGSSIDPFSKEFEPVHDDKIAVSPTRGVVDLTASAPALQPSRRRSSTVIRLDLRDLDQMSQMVHKRRPGTSDKAVTKTNTNNAARKAGRRVQLEQKPRQIDKFKFSASNHLPGTRIMYGSLVALQSVSGGFLTLKRKTVKMSQDGMHVVRNTDGMHGDDPYLDVETWCATDPPYPQHRPPYKCTVFRILNARNPADTSRVRQGDDIVLEPEDTRDWLLGSLMNLPRASSSNVQMLQRRMEEEKAREEAENNPNGNTALPRPDEGKGVTVNMSNAGDTVHNVWRPQALERSRDTARFTSWKLVMHGEKGVAPGNRQHSKTLRAQQKSRKKRVWTDTMLTQDDVSHHSLISLHQDWGHLCEIGVGKDDPVPPRVQNDNDPEIDVASASTVVVAFEPRAKAANTRAKDIRTTLQDAAAKREAEAAIKSSPVAAALAASPKRGGEIVEAGSSPRPPVPFNVITNQSEAMSALSATLRSAVGAGRNPLYGSRYFSMVAHPPGSLVEHEDRMEHARSQQKFDTMFRLIGHTDLSSLPPHVREKMAAARAAQKAAAAAVMRNKTDFVHDLRQEQAKFEQHAAEHNPYLSMLGQESVHEPPRVSLKGMWRIYLCSENATNFEMPGVSKDSTFAKLMNVASLQLDALEKSNDEHRHLISKLKLDVDMTKIRARRVKRWDERMKGARSHAAQATIMQALTVEDKVLLSSMLEDPAFAETLLSHRQRAQSPDTPGDTARSARQSARASARARAATPGAKKALVDKLIEELFGNPERYFASRQRGMNTAVSRSLKLKPLTRKHAADVNGYNSDSSSDAGSFFLEDETLPPTQRALAKARANAESANAQALVKTQVWQYMNKKTLLLELLRENTVLLSAVRSVQRAWRSFRQNKWKRRIWQQDKSVKSQIRREEKEWQSNKATAMLLLGPKKDDPKTRYKRPLSLQHDDAISELGDSDGDDDHSYPEYRRVDREAVLREHAYAIAHAANGALPAFPPSKARSASDSSDFTLPDPTAATDADVLFRESVLEATSQAMDVTGAIIGGSDTGAVANPAHNLAERRRSIVHAEEGSAANVLTPGGITSGITPGSEGHFEFSIGATGVSTAAPDTNVASRRNPLRSARRRKLEARDQERQAEEAEQRKRRLSAQYFEEALRKLQPDDTAEADPREDVWRSLSVCSSPRDDTADGPRDGAKPTPHPAPRDPITGRRLDLPRLSVVVQSEADADPHGRTSRTQASDTQRSQRSLRPAASMPNMRISESSFQRPLSQHEQRAVATAQATQRAKRVQSREDLTHTTDRGLRLLALQNPEVFGDVGPEGSLLRHLLHLDNRGIGNSPQRAMPHSQSAQQFGARPAVKTSRPSTPQPRSSAVPHVDTGASNGSPAAAVAVGSRANANRVHVPDPTRAMTPKQKLAYTLRQESIAHDLAKAAEQEAVKGPQLRARPGSSPPGRRRAPAASPDRRRRASYGPGTRPRDGRVTAGGGRGVQRSRPQSSTGRVSLRARPAKYTPPQARSMRRSKSAARVPRGGSKPPRATWRDAVHSRQAAQGNTKSYPGHREKGRPRPATSGGGGSGGPSQGFRAPVNGPNAGKGHRQRQGRAADREERTDSASAGSAHRSAFTERRLPIALQQPQQQAQHQQRQQQQRQHQQQQQQQQPHHAQVPQHQVARQGRAATKVTGRVAARPMQEGSVRAEPARSGAATTTTSGQAVPVRASHNRGRAQQSAGNHSVSRNLTRQLAGARHEQGAHSSHGDANFAKQGVRLGQAAPHSYKAGATATKVAKTAHRALQDLHTAESWRVGGWESAASPNPPLVRTASGISRRPTSRGEARASSPATTGAASGGGNLTPTMKRAVVDQLSPEVVREVQHKWREAAGELQQDISNSNAALNTRFRVERQSSGL